VKQPSKQLKLLATTMLEQLNLSSILQMTNFISWR